MVGACYYVATLKNGGGGHAEPGGMALDKESLQRRIAGDHLTPVFHRAIFRDLPMLFVPFHYAGDRGVALEEAWKDNLGGALEVPFKSLAAGEEEGWRPSLIVTPMLVEDGRQLIISNLFLHFMTENAGAYLESDPDQAPTNPRDAGQFTQRRPRAVGREKSANAGTPPYRYSLSSLEFFSLFPDGENNKLKLGTAARMNASFPYVSPGVDLPTRPRRRVVDAGYYDNYGVETAASWIYHYKGWLQEHTSGVVLIQVRDAASDQRRLSPGDGTTAEEDKWNWSRGIEWLTGPLVGAAAARESVMSFRNDEQLEGLSDLFNGPGRDEFFTTVVFNCRQEIALNWYLSPKSIQDIRDGWQDKGNQHALKALEKWWGNSPEAKKPR
jgi:hypothetical protein